MALYRHLMYTTSKGNTFSLSTPDKDTEMSTLHFTIRTSRHLEHAVRLELYCTKHQEYLTGVERQHGYGTETKFLY